MGNLRILFVTPYVPSPLRVRPYNLIKHLSAAGHRVTVMAVCTSHDEYADATTLAPLCERVETVRVPLGRSLWNCLRGLGSGLPLQALYSYSPVMAHRLALELDGRQAPRRDPYDVLHVEHLRGVLFGLHVTGLPRVYDAVDCISRLFEKVARMGATPVSRWRAAIDLQRTRRFEAELLGRFDHILTSSAADRDALTQLARRSAESSADAVAHAITVLPNGVDGQYFAPRDAPRAPATLVFAGRMGYHANVAAVLYFVREVLPLIWAQRPDVQLLVVGKHPARDVTALARRYGPRVRVTGYVPDMRPYIGRATVAVNPLLYAVGIQNKVLEAMAMATPVVTTPAGMTSLQARDGDELLVARDRREFARQVLRLLSDPALRQRLGDAGRRYVETQHDWTRVVSQLQHIYEYEVAAFRQRPLLYPPGSPQQ